MAMQEQRIAHLAPRRRVRMRRLPVVEDGKVVGILALNDIFGAADRRHTGIGYEEVMDTMKS